MAEEFLCVDEGVMIGACNSCILEIEVRTCIGK